MRNRKVKSGLDVVSCGGTETYRCNFSHSTGMLPILTIWHSFCSFFHDEGGTHTYSVASDLANNRDRVWLRRGNLSRSRVTSGDSAVYADP